MYVYDWKTAKSLKNLDRTTAVGWWYYKVVSFRYYIGKRE